MTVLPCREFSQGNDEQSVLCSLLRTVVVSFITAKDPFACVQIVGPYHASAKEAFPAQAGVADRNATRYVGSPGAGVEGAQQWQAVEAPPVNPLDAAGPGKRKVPWEGERALQSR